MSTDSPTTAGATAVTGKDEPAPDPAPGLVAEGAEVHRPPHPEAGEHGAHPTDRQYILIALILAAITAVEVGISYAKGLGDASNPLLLILAAIKFFMVVAFFMHLKFDNRVFRRFLVTGIILAAIVYTIVFFTLGIFTSQHGIHGVIGGLVLISAAVNPWRYNTHPEVWLIVVVAAAGYWYAVTRLGPAGAGGAGGASGAASVSRRQVMWFGSGLAVLWLASDWPLHDLAENYLYSAHMVEHLLISLVAPPMLLMGVPDWLTRLLLRPRSLSGTVRVVCRPLVAGAIFNTVIAVGHAPFYVDFTLYHHFWHFWAHLLLFVASMIMWFPVVNRLPEYPTMNPPLKMVYLFLQSVIPNVPVAFLTFSTGVVYSFYGHVPRPFGISVLTDQQLAGAIMKIGGTTVLWSVILVVFFHWYGDQVRADRAEQRAWRAETSGATEEPVGQVGPTDEDMPDVLTWEHVVAELAKSQPAKPGSGGT